MIALIAAKSSSQESRRLQNKVTNDKFPLAPLDSSSEALRTIGDVVDKDMMLMIPSPAGQRYSMHGFVNCFANVSTTRERMSKDLSRIHGGVRATKRS